MYPNPANVLPVPPRPNLEQYKKRAKALVKACTSGERDTIRPWAADWLQSLASTLKTSDGDRGAWFDQRVYQLEDFAGSVRVRGANRMCPCRRAIHHRAGAWVQELAAICKTHHRAHSHDLALRAVRIGGRGHHHRRRGDAQAPTPCKSGADTRAVAARSSSDAPAVRRG